MTDSRPPDITLGKGLPYPPGTTCGEGAFADRRHAFVRVLNQRLIEQATATVAAGYSPSDAGVHIRFAGRHTVDALSHLADLCTCDDPMCLVRAAKLLIADLALRIGGAMNVGQPS